MASKIFIAWDGSAGATSGLAHAVDLAVKCGAGLHIGRVLRAVLDYKENFVVPEEIAQAAKDSCKKAEMHARAEGVSAVTTSLLLGQPEDAIIGAAKDLGCDLIITGTHARTGVSRFLLGSVAESVLAQVGTAMPVLVTRAQADDKPVDHKKLLVPFDGTEVSIRALKYALALGAATKAAVNIVHVYNAVPAGGDMFLSLLVEADANERRQLMRDRAKLQATEVIERAKLVATEANYPVLAETLAIASDAVDDEIVRLSADFDLVVMGSASQGMRKLVHSSHTINVLRHTHTAVVVVQ